MQEPDSPPARIRGLNSSAAGHGARVAGNSIANMFGRLASLLFWLLLTPTILRHLGPTRFGLWSLLFVFTSYLLMMDLGIGASMARFTAEFRAGNRMEELSRLIATANLFYLCLTALATMAVLVFGAALVQALRIPPEIPEAPRILVLFAIAGGTTSFASVQNGVLTGFQRLGLQNAINTGALIPSALGIWLSLHLGHGLEGVVWVQTCVPLMVGLAGWLAVRRIEPRLPLRWPGWHPEVARPLVQFGVWMQLSTLVNLLQTQVDKLFLSRWVGMASLTSLELGSRVSNGLFALPTLAFTAVTPAAADLFARGDGQRILALHLRGMRWIAALSLPLLASTWIAGPWLLHGWLGAVPAGAELSLRLMALALALNVLTGTGTSILAGEGRPQLSLALQSVSLALHLGLSVWLIPRQGLQGALVAQVAASAVWTVSFCAAFHLARGWSWTGGFLAPLWRPALVAAASLAILGAASRVWPAADSLGRGPSLGVGLAMLLGTALFSGGALLAVGQFDRSDRELMAHLCGWRRARARAPGGHSD